MVAQELGKYPNEVADTFDTYDLAEFLAYRKIVADEQSKAAKRQERLSKNR